MTALHDVVKAGYVRYIGMSSCYAWQCTRLSPVKQISSVIYSRRSSRDAKLRHCEQPYTLHLHAKPLQSGLQRGRTRDDADLEGGRYLTYEVIIGSLQLIVLWRWLHPLVSSCPRNVVQAVRQGPKGD